VSSPLLTVNGIEVIYNHVILVRKGVSLTVPAGGIVALLGANGRGQDHHPARRLQPAARRARRGHQGLHRVQGRRVSSGSRLRSGQARRGGR